MTTIEQQYQKLDEISHVRLRPAMYISSIKFHKEELFIPKDEKSFEFREVNYIP